MKKSYAKQHSVFAAKIKALRISKGLTQVELAGRMDVDLRTVKRLEGGKKYNPTLTTIYAVADALGVNVRDLF